MEKFQNIRYLIYVRRRIGLVTSKKTQLVILGQVLPSLFSLFYLQICFVALHMDLEQLSSLAKGDEWHGEDAKIFYSKTFDILQQGDRTGLMKFMLLLACLQQEDLLTKYGDEI